ncbi:kinase-like protein [Favolaschia claudopus]|uniref:Kinase-like protein n=1 Tax=Favolaschia claudopus TaxID=2862362 RepID=A0AAW0AER6_9AGAR
MALWKNRESLLSSTGSPQEDLRHEDFEAEMALCLTNILDFGEVRHAALGLEGEDAQAFLDAVQHVLYCGSLPTARYTNIARELMQRIAGWQDQLPTSLFITGVHDLDEQPKFAGRFGDVYRAFHGGKCVSLKRLRIFTAEMGSPKRLRFCREALVWQSLCHPFILPFLGIDRDSLPPSFCMVSPWMKHGTILNFLAAHGRTDIHRLTLEIAQGLHYLHSMNIVHGDLNGSNILVTDDAHACLSDFSLAMTTIQDEDSPMNYASSLRWTAPELLVPEQFGFERFIKTRATDVYAFACACIELETGRVPFAEVTEIQAMFNILRGLRPDQPETMTDRMYDLVTEAWAEDFHDRPDMTRIVSLLEDGRLFEEAHTRDFIELWGKRGSLTLQGGVSEQSLHEQFEAQIASCLENILDYREARHAALRLQGENAEAFLDAVQHVLYCGSLPTATYANTARKLMQRISEAHDQLPTSLFITGVYDRDEHPTFAGGFGEVYRAFHGGKCIALKRLRTFTSESGNAKRMKFCREALIWQGLRHPFVLPFLGIDRHSFPSSFCMASPWLKHGTILRFLADRGRTDIHRLTLEITKGLHYLHSVNIVHGDLRGANILVNNEAHACLSDFGLATTIQDADSQTAMTSMVSSSNHGGGLRWTAPELLYPQQFGLERYAKTRATDVYAFACVCIELETGKPPFTGVSDGQAMFNTLGGIRPVQPEAMPDKMYKLVTEAWAQDFRDRPDTVKIIHWLEEFPGV